MDTATSKLYVGSTGGNGGIWQRWCACAQTSHGDNVELKAMDAEPGDRFRCSIQGIADPLATGDQVLERSATGRTFSCPGRSATRTDRCCTFFPKKIMPKRDAKVSKDHSREEPPVIIPSAGFPVFGPQSKPAVPAGNKAAAEQATIRFCLQTEFRQ